MPRKKPIRYWLINIYTRACFGPYDSYDEAYVDKHTDLQPDDWDIAKMVVKK